MPSPSHNARLQHADPAFGPRPLYMASGRSQAEVLPQGPPRTGSPTPDVSSTHENGASKETAATGLTTVPTVPKRDKLYYRPFILSNAALFSSITINCGILAGLIVFEKRTYFVVSIPAYYALLALLILIGTCTGATAGETILRSYFPAPSFRDAGGTKNWLLILACTIYIPSYSIIGFKSALLYESWDDTDYWEAENGKCWHGFGTDDTESGDILPDVKAKIPKPAGDRRIAQSSVELRHLTPSGLDHPNQSPNASPRVSGECISVKPTESGSHPGSSDDGKSSMISIRTLALIRYNSAWAVANPLSVYIHFSLAFSLMVLFILGISIIPSVTPDGGHCWEPRNLSLNWGIVLFDVVLTTTVSLLSNFWAALSLFVAHTEPLARMARPSEPGEAAKNTLLLNYTCSFLPVRIYNAFMNKHWKLVRIMFWELL
ncbi:hypothetical protein CCUS01_08498 [Colletotrichum cuscutae]|uniref:Uncharacterized protein n=1 Tax=Colletotrichum cuscutae TaxID=1209917 RepID=A0AAI9XWR4_9PEZI|nr:hypothetical protein CCUS01_08498 [Colletotrichum cuscutae]